MQYIHLRRGKGVSYLLKKKRGGSKGKRKMSEGRREEMRMEDRRVEGEKRKMEVEGG